MAVDALELRPRNAVAIFDAALRVCATSTGPWALTLPAGALVVLALFNLVEAITRQEPLGVPVALWTLAWAARALGQGAACHYLEQQVLGTGTPSMCASARAALNRAPALVTAAAWLAVLNTAIATFSLGLGFFFFGAHAVGYAATMRGQGSVLGLYGTCSKLLGPTRHSAPWVRLLGASQLLLAFNLHLAVTFGLQLANSLFGFDVTFVERFASADNAVWLAVLAAVTFTLFEPLRAATATLLLIDGRVRQEGLDLLAQVEQLPARRKARGGGAAAVVALLVALVGARAAAQPGPASLERAQRLVDECEMSGNVDLSPLERGVPSEEQSSLSRFLSRVERRVFEEEDCDAAEADLREGLRLYGEAQAAEAPPDDPRAQASDILSRPEFQATPPRADKPAADEGPEEPGWLAKLIRRFLEWLFERDEREPRRAPSGDFNAGGMTGANAVMVVAFLLVAGVLVYVLVRSVQKNRRQELAPDESGRLFEQALAADTMSALSRPPRTWAGLADELAARGEYREAIRHLYLALLSQFHRDGAIDYDPTRSNWEYLLAFKGSSTAKAAFRELTRRFDFAWYGNLGVDALAYAMFRQLVAPFLQETEGAPAHA